jgi:hypothetical protein
METKNPLIIVGSTPVISVQYSGPLGAAEGIILLFGKNRLGV